MKTLYFLLCTLVCGAVGISLTIIDSDQDVTTSTCAKGPVYWCENIKTAKFCGAVSHCIQTVWEHQQLPVDNDEVCTICKDMVTQARDQLESNETQEEIKEVFEGSCNLLPLKIVSKECCKIADEFIPELVETLASQMNPQVVCSVAGLCNNAEIDSLLKNKRVTSKDCRNCDVVVSEMKKKFDAASRDDVLTSFLEICGRFGSYSDGCSAIVIRYFNEIYSHLKKNLESGAFCHLAGVCSSKFHSHRKDVEITYESSVGIVAAASDNLPCELCEDLVKHLHDILVANTTEDEFKDMLVGFCKQTKSFQSECLSLVDQYYQIAYEFMVNGLDPAEVCITVQLCPQTTHKEQAPVWPLVASEVVEAAKLSPAEKVESTKIRASVINPAQEVESSDDIMIPWIPLNTAHKQVTGAKLHRVSLTKDDSAVKASHVGAFQLPAERLMPQAMLGVGNKDACEFCQYFLHYLQQAITAPKTESELKELVESACTHLPTSVSEQCRSFVETYGDAAIALLAQDIDPSMVCPMLRICPGDGILLDPTTTVKDKPTCPLCLLAVQEVISKLKDNKTEDNIKKELDGLCNDLPKSLAPDCVQFVNTYSDELVDMLVADFTAQEVCTYLKLCDPTGEHVSVIDSGESIEIISNEIPPLPMQRMMPQAVISATMDVKNARDSSVCILCEFVMSKLENILKENSTDEDIKNAVRDVCNILPSTISKECNDFINQYADLIILFLSESLDPKQVCTAIDLCKGSSLAVQELKNSFAECAVCEAAVGALEELIGEDPTVNGKITTEIKKVCALMPAKDQRQCDAIIATYGPSMVNLMTEMVGGRLVCLKIGLCVDENRQAVELLGGSRCTWGPSYWCQSAVHAAACKTTKHCQEFVWNGKQ
ncbi:prosaposin [Bacillus rossius redtenbacheri]|uniref:prosaposin n=1 Tax=Bacillus rossius redtenbacheri TaxID=93214 RepID=UPI002FDE883F